MLALKQALSLPSLRSLAWSPLVESSLVAWYKNRTGITTTVSLSPIVTEWADSSLNSYDMVQATESESPVYTPSSGSLTFLSANDTNLQTASQISLTGDFSIGLRINTETTNGAFLADNTSANEFFKYSGISNDRIAFKIAGSAATNLDLDSGTFGDDYLIITRLSNVFTLWKNGVAQTGTTPTVAGTSLIDVIGLRRIDTNGFDGTIKEIQIYSSSSAKLTTRINTRLKTL
jgi:hypothetical protein